MSFYRLQILSSSQSYQFASSHPTSSYIQIFFFYIFSSQTHLFATHLYHILYTQTLFPSKTYMDAFTRRRIFTQQLFHTYFHKQFVFTRRGCNTLTDVLHAQIFSQKIFTHRRFYTVVFTHQNLQCAASFAHRYFFHTQAVLHTARFFLK